ncbi:MAG: hypothetical protein GY820_42885 [Gammaproteobacteria bacterium]|nr:hypothetical protein [Gammaproteobacteria bacterium]
MIFEKPKNTCFLHYRPAEPEQNESAHYRVSYQKSHISKNYLTIGISHKTRYEEVVTFARPNSQQHLNSTARHSVTVNLFLLD